MFERYTRGYNLGECYRMASDKLGWMGVVVGDPKVSPFRDVPDVRLDSAHVTASNLTPAAGADLSIRAVVDNLGGRVEGMPVSLQLDGTEVWAGDATFDKFSRTTLAFSMVAPSSKGKHEVRVVLNKMGPGDVPVIFETFLTNNEGAVDIDVRERPTIALLAEPSTALTFDSLKFTIDVASAPFAITGYFFDFGDGTPEVTGTAPEVLHAFAQDGVFIVSAYVLDNRMVASWRANATVRIKDRVPSPVITVSPPSAPTGIEMTFDSTLSTDPDGNVTSVHWDLGDGNASDARVVSHAYASPGEYVVTLTVKDDDNSTATSSRRVVALNRPPVAGFVADNASVMKGRPLGFNASGSTDPDGRIVQYEWDFGDGSQGEVKGSPWVVHAFAHAGTMTVTLSVYDDVGAKGTTTRTVEVLDTLPVPALELSRPSILTGESIDLDASGSYDPDGIILNYEFSASRDGGVPEIVASGEFPTAQFTPTEDGNFTLSLRVMDDDGGSASTSAAFRVLDRPPRVVLSAATDELNGTVLTAPASVDVAVDATDPDGTVRSIRWYVGLDEVAQGASATLSFVREAVVALSVVVIDDDGSTTRQAISFTVNERPHANLSILQGGKAVSTAPVRVGALLSYDASNSTHAPQENLTYTWDLGDGTVIAGTRETRLTHSYPAPGVYTVTLTVKDKYGGTDTATQSIVVERPKTEGASGGLLLLEVLAVVGVVAAVLVVWAVVVMSRRGREGDQGG